MIYFVVVPCKSCDSPSWVFSFCLIFRVRYFWARPHLYHPTYEFLANSLGDSASEINSLYVALPPSTTSKEHQGQYGPSNLFGSNCSWGIHLRLIFTGANARADAWVIFLSISFLKPKGVPKCHLLNQITGMPLSALDRTSLFCNLCQLRLGGSNILNILVSSLWSLDWFNSGGRAKIGVHSLVHAETITVRQVSLLGY